MGEVPIDLTDLVSLVGAGMSHREEVVIQMVIKIEHHHEEETSLIKMTKKTISN